MHLRSHALDQNQKQNILKLLLKFLIHVILLTIN